MRDTEATQERAYEQVGNKPDAVRVPGGTIGGADKAEGMPGGEQASEACREVAKTVLNREIREARRQCRSAGLREISLQALYDCLPKELSQEADEALWELLMAARRKQQLI